MTLGKNCPNCSAATQDGAAECPSCGVIFGKLKEKKQREFRDARTALASIDELAPKKDGPVPFWHDRWKVRIAAAAVVALWMLGFGLYYRARVAVMKHDKSPRFRSSQTGATLLDPAGGTRHRLRRLIC